MEIIQEVPKKTFDTIHQKAIRDMAQSDESAYIVGMHTARMNIRGEIRKTIIPSVTIFIPRQTELGVNSYMIKYHVTLNAQTFPLAHVYGSSGYLCLGNIPVSPYVSSHNLMAPLETLFLYNDRYVNHGHPTLNISVTQHKKIVEWCHDNELEIKSDKHDYILNDTVWDIGAQLVEKYDIETAYQLADEFFRLCFILTQENVNRTT